MQIGFVSPHLRLAIKSNRVETVHVLAIEEGEQAIHFPCENEEKAKASDHVTNRLDP